MPRMRAESSRTTLFQLAALTSALTHGGFAAAASELGVKDKHRLIKAVSRLADNLQLEGLTNRIGDDLVFPMGLSELEPSASRVLAAISDFERTAESLRTKTVLVRCATYPSMVTTFLADAAAIFEDTGIDSKPHLQLVNLDSAHRRESGASLIRALFAKAADVAIGPTSTMNLEASEIFGKIAYRWQVVAAIQQESSAA